MLLRIHLACTPEGAPVAGDCWLEATDCVMAVERFLRGLAELSSPTQWAVVQLPDHNGVGGGTVAFPLRSQSIDWSNPEGPVIDGRIQPW
jgi:hypothetical protein